MTTSASKRRLVCVRPRVGSALEAIQSAKDNDMSDLVHAWADKDPEAVAIRQAVKKMEEEK